jgi:hypothetical protein
MVDRISVQIALEGGDLIQKQLADIGDAGQKAFADIAASANKVGGFKELDPGTVTSKLKEMGLEGTQAFDKIQSAVKQASWLESIVKGVETVENAFLAVGRVAAPIVTAIAGAFLAAAENAIAFAGEINKINTEATELKLTIDQFDQLRKGMEQAGLSAGAVSSGIKTFAEQLDKLELDKVTQAFKQLHDSMKQGFGVEGSEQLKILQDAAQGTGKAADTARKFLEKLGLTDVGSGIKSTAEAFKILGVEATNINEALPQVIEALQKMPDSAQRTALALQLFGKQAGAELIAALRTGGVAIDAFRDKLGVLTQDQANKAAALEQAINRLQSTWARFGSVALAPALTVGINLLTEDLQALQRFIENFSWDKFLSGGLKALAALTDPFGTLRNMLFDFSESLGQIAWDALSSAAQNAWQTVIKWIDNAKNKLAEFVQGLSGSIWDAIVSGAQNGWQTIIQWIDAGKNKFAEFVQNLTSSIWDAIVTSAQNAWQTIIQWIDQAKQKFLDFAGALANDIWSGVLQGAINLWNQLANAIQFAIDRLKVFLGLAPAGTGSVRNLPDEQSMASGGLIGGAGTGTSDSNLAWVSRGEHIMPARAVAQPGVLAFLEALRGTGGDLRAVLNGMGRFALGGLVSRPIPAFAAGGLVAGMHPVTINFAAHTVDGLRASSAVVSELQRAAALAQVRSGGRKPSRYS